MQIAKTLIIMLGFFVALLANAEEAQKVEQTAKEKAVQELVTKKFQAIEQTSKLKIDTVKESPIKGLYRVETAAGGFLFSEDGNYFIMGDLYQLKDKEIVNLDEERRMAEMAKLNPVRKEKLAALDPKGFLVFPATKERKAIVTIATDIDCGYCRKLHQEMSQYNDLGIEIRYLAFPRAGKDSDSYKKILAAWCAPNPQEAMTKAKAGEEIPMITCDKSKDIDAHMKFVEEMGLRGTPSLILEDGKLLPGYMPPEALAEELGLIQKPKEEAKAADTKGEEKAETTPAAGAPAAEQPAATP